MQTKKIIKKITITLLLIFIFQTSFSQKNYLKGYIVSLKGDTISGYIDYHNWKNNPKEILFTEVLNGEKKNCNALNIKEFAVGGERFESAIVQLEVSSFKKSELDFSNELNLNTDTLFLRTIIKGNKSLYSYKNKSVVEQFYVKNKNSYELLRHKKYLIETESGDQVEEDKRYKMQLSFYLKDCTSIQSELISLEYEKKNIEELFLYYYNNIKSDFLFHKKREGISVEIGALVGMCLTNLEFGFGYPIKSRMGYVARTNYDQSITPTLGVFFDVVYPNSMKRWSLCNELIFTSYKVTGSYNDYRNKDYYTITHSSIGYSHLKVNNLVRYKYPIKNAYVYLNVGISNGFGFNETNYSKQEIKRFTTTRIEEDIAIDEFREYEQGFLIGLGFKYKRYSFEIRREGGISHKSGLSSTTKRCYFLLGYRF